MCLQKERKPPAVTHGGFPGFLRSDDPAHHRARRGHPIAAQSDSRVAERQHPAMGHARKVFARKTNGPNPSPAPDPAIRSHPVDPRANFVSTNSVYPNSVNPGSINPGRTAAPLPNRGRQVRQASDPDSPNTCPTDTGSTHACLGFRRSAPRIDHALATTQ